MKHWFAISIRCNGVKNALPTRLNYPYWYTCAPVHEWITYVRYLIFLHCNLGQAAQLRFHSMPLSLSDCRMQMHPMWLLKLEACIWSDLRSTSTEKGASRLQIPTTFSYRVQFTVTTLLPTIKTPSYYFIIINKQSNQPTIICYLS